MKNLLIPLVMLSSFCYAEDSVIISGLSQHPNLDSKYETPNSRNFGIGWEHSETCDTDLEATFHVLAYRDSYYATASQVALGARYRVLAYREVNYSIGASAGLMWGSGFDGVGAYIYQEVGWRDKFIRFHIVPKTNDRNSWVIGLTYRQVIGE